jgi:hypothetical protein
MRPAGLNAAAMLFDGCDQVGARSDFLPAAPPLVWRYLRNDIAPIIELKIATLAGKAAVVGLCPKVHD